MCEKKKTTLYTTSETTALIERGIEMFSNESPTGILTKTSLIELCVKKAIVEDPKEIEEERNYSRGLEKENSELKKEREVYRSILRKMVKLSHLKNDLDNSIQDALNME